VLLALKRPCPVRHGPRVALAGVCADALLPKQPPNRAENPCVSVPLRRVCACVRAWVHVFGRLVREPKLIAKRYLKSWFAIDLMSCE
jgi:hypothetical protein